MEDIKFHKWRGVERLKETIDSYNNILVYFDPDVDGMISGYFICKYLESLGKEYYYYVNPNRSHDWGISISNRDVIAVDFKITKDIILGLVKDGVNIISIDHHVNQDARIIVNWKGKSGVVINNQYPFEEDDGRYLSGAGVVFETLRLLDSKFDTEENRALVGLTLLSDVCDIENPNARGYLSTLYNHKYKGYIKYLISSVMGDKDYGFGVPRMDRRFVDFRFSPSINSSLRFNKGEEVIRFFLRQGSVDLTCHARQKILVQAMQDVARVREFSHLTLVFVYDWEVQTDEDISLLSNFIGLIASRYLDRGKSVLAYLISVDDNGERYIVRASFRGHVSSGNYLDGFNKLDEDMIGIGHPPAFGVKNFFPTKELIGKINELCSQVDGDNIPLSKITPVSNLSVFSVREGKRYAEHNMYCLSQSSYYVRYIGSNIKVKVDRPTFQKYLVDGIEVLSFDKELTFADGLIYPIYERGYLYYYLQREE